VIGKRISWVAMGALACGAAFLGLVGCELIASVDRTEIPTGTGGTGGTGTGGGGTGGTPYAMADYAEEDAYTDLTEALPAEGADPVTMGIEFRWEEAAARPLPFDLSVRLAGVEGPLVQVFSLEEGPFVRAGSRVEAISRDADYRIEVSRTPAAAWAQVVRASDGEVLLSGPVMEVEPSSGDSLTLRLAKEHAHVHLGALRTWRAAPIQAVPAR
jgi:hypothetical protein